MHSMIWDSIHYLERSKSYETAIFLLRYILQDTFTYPLRRGKYYVRLILDLEHAGKPDEALEACLNGLNDKSVYGAHVISLNRKIEKLKSKVVNFKGC